MNFIKSIFRIIKTTILTIFLICLVIFMVNNRDVINIHLHPLPFEIQTRMFMVMIIFFLFGLSFGLLACSQNILHRMVSSFQDRRKIKQLEKKVSKD